MAFLDLRIAGRFFLYCERPCDPFSVRDLFGGSDLWGGFGFSCGS